MLLWISDPVSDIVSAGNGDCKQLIQCGTYEPCSGVKCAKLKKCGCYGGLCHPNFKHRKKKKGKK